MPRVTQRMLIIPGRSVHIPRVQSTSQALCGPVGTGSEGVRPAPRRLGVCTKQDARVERGREMADAKREAPLRSRTGTVQTSRAEGPTAPAARRIEFEPFHSGAGARNRAAGQIREGKTHAMPPASVSDAPHIAHSALTRGARSRTAPFPVHCGLCQVPEPRPSTTSCCSASDSVASWPTRPAPKSGLVGV